MAIGADGAAPFTPMAAVVADKQPIAWGRPPKRVQVGSGRILNLQVCLPSGRCGTVSLPLDSSVAELKLAAQESLGQMFLKLAAPNGRLLDRTETLQHEGLENDDSVTAIAQQPKIVATSCAFALWCVGGDRVVTWVLSPPQCGSPHVTTVPSAKIAAKASLAAWIC